MSIPEGRYAWFGPDEPTPKWTKTRRVRTAGDYIFGAFLIVWVVVILFITTGHAQTVDDVAHAIAKTEGFYVHGTKPNRYHNPGDVRRFRGTKYPGEVRRDRFGYVVFQSDAYGWSALDRNLRRIVDGTSTYYATDPTFAQIAKSYATDKRWGKSVCKILQVNPQATMREYLGLAPRIQLTAKVSDGTTFMWLFEKRNDVPDLREMPTLLAQIR